MAGEVRIACDGKACPRSRGRRPGDEAWLRWICPKCWDHVRADTRAGICRLRTQLGKAVRKARIGDVRAITARLIITWDQAASQIRLNSPHPREAREPMHVDAGE